MKSKVPPLPYGYSCIILERCLKGKKKKEKKSSASHSRCSWTVCNLVWRDWMLSFHRHWNPRAPCLTASISRNSAMNMFQKRESKNEGERKKRSQGGRNTSWQLAWVLSSSQNSGEEQCSRDVAWETADVFSRENNNSLAQNSSYGCTVKFEQEPVPWLEMPTYKNREHARFFLLWHCVKDHFTCARSKPSLFSFLWGREA